MSYTAAVAARAEEVEMKKVSSAYNNNIHVVTITISTSSSSSMQVLPQQPAADAQQPALAVARYLELETQATGRRDIAAPSTIPPVARATYKTPPPLAVGVWLKDRACRLRQRPKLGAEVIQGAHVRGKTMSPRLLVPHHMKILSGELLEQEASCCQQGVLELLLSVPYYNAQQA
eukprot:CAMPEP_0194583582 /NCGR_PEP_ID=MMETSP0292-20121207/16436_1 /TAXON_ID=39354 /ORGANISM="Heterosigma akashiwo, Strain CCMP2393" /LENGTH=174 /DNA_ID=CAMNT_0039438253 /DNA_START=399 /DNA_END=922 /DNA_ORIENTATION=+